MLNVLAKIQQAEAGLVKKFNRLLLLGFAALAIPGIGRTKDPVAVKWSPAVHEYCRVLRFPQGWQIAIMSFAFRASLGQDPWFVVLRTMASSSPTQN